MNYRIFWSWMILLCFITVGIAAVNAQEKSWSRKTTKTSLDLTNTSFKAQGNGGYYGSMIYRKNAAPIDAPDVPVTSLTNTTQSENSIFFNPMNPNIVLNSNNSSDYPLSDIYGTSYFLSSDGGLTWSGSVHGPGGDNSGDPATAISRDGRYYIGFIHSNGGQGCSYSTNGTSWTSVVISTVASSSDLLDKNHLWIDNSPTSSYQGYLYSVWTRFETGNANNNQIEVSQSTNGGLNWSTPVNISSSIAAGSHNQGVNVQTGPNGEVYAVWAIYDSWPQDEPRLGFAKSLNGGQTWTTGTRIGPTIKGIRSSGLLGGKDMRNSSFPTMTVSQTTGHIYVAWTNIGVPGTNTGTERDNWVMKSTDGGDTWLTPVRINQDTPNNGKDQWFPWIASDPVTGTIGVAFYDSRDFTNNDSAHTYVAISNDGGATWEDFRVSDAAWSGDGSGSGFSGNYAGDYIGISMLNGKVIPVWTDRRLAGRLMTWVSPFTLSDPTDPKPVTAASAYSDYTSPTSMDIVWTDPTEFSNGNPIDTFVVDIYRADTLRGTVPKGTETFTETGLIDGTQWSYKLKVRHIPTDSMSFAVETAPWYVGGHPVPNGATNLQVTSDVSSAYLKWHNPTTNLDGTPIDDLDSIRIFRNGVHIANVEYTGIADSTYTDVIYTLDGAYYNYKVQVIDNETPVNTGAFSNEAQVYVGPVPAISVNPDTLFYNVITGVSDTSSYWIHNTGGDTLEVTGIRAEELTTEKFVPTWAQPQKYTPNYGKGEQEPTYGAQTEGKGGPDPYGYKWKDSDEPGGPTYVWNDITGTGTLASTWVATGSFGPKDEGYSGPYNLGFDFKFYGQTYTQIYINANGYLTFTQPTASSITNAAIPATAVPNGFISAFWDDLDGSSAGTVHYQQIGNKFVVQFTGWPKYGSGGGPLTFQMVLSSGGKVEFYYNSMNGTINSATVGIENETGTIGTQVAYNATYVKNNLAVSISKGVDWLVQTPTTGKVAPGDSMEVMAIVNATGLVGATYTAQVFIDHNIPLQAAYEHPVISMLVTGATDIGVTPDTLNFGTNFITIPDTLQFTVSNTGTDTLHVSGMTNDSSQFTIVGATAFDIPVAGSRNVEVVFISPVSGTFEDMVTITSDGSSGTKHVHLLGTAVEMPQLTILPDSLYFNIDPAMTDSAYIGLFNTGLGSLSVTGIEAEEISSEGTFVQPQKYTPDYPKGTEEPTFGEQTEGSGGPDPFGYKWKDSDAPGGPSYNWYDISSVGTAITSWTSGGDDGYAQVTLPFAFKFYGTPYSSIYVGTNGILSFGSGTTSLSNAAIPATGTPNNFLAPMWDDLNTSGGSVKYYHDAANGRFIIQYDVVRYGTTNQYLFQVMLYTSGKIVYQYNNMAGTRVNEATIGIENSTGTMGLQVVYNANYVHNNLAIVFQKGVDWLTLNPLTGTIASGDSMMVKALVNSTGLSNGVYKARLIIGSNDPVTPTQYAKVTLNVGTVDVDPDNMSGPNSYALHQNYPNPFNPTTTIKYDLKDAGKVSLKIYNILGQEVRTLVNTNEMAGFKSVVWDGKDNSGKAVSSGLYIYRLETGKFTKSHKMMLLK